LSDTKILAAYAAGLSYSEIPAPVIERMKDCLLDSLGANEYLIATEKPCILKPANVEDIQRTVLEFLECSGPLGP